MQTLFPSRRSRLVALLFAANLALIACVVALLIGPGRAGVPGGASWLTSPAAAGEPAPGLAASLAGAPFVAKSPVADVAHRISPGVVSIGAVKRVFVRDRFADDFFAQFFNAPVREMRERAPYLGSGSLIDGAGHVITNFHVVEGAEAVFVTLGDGRELEATFIAGDRYIDLALLKINEPTDLPTPIAFGDSDDLQIGETVVALGNPFGPMMEDPRPTVTSGVVSALHRTFRPDLRTQRVYQDMIQTDAAINPGNSGGPLVDIEGRLIGINTFIFSSSGGSQGIGFAIPVNRARSLVEEVRRYGHVRQILLDFDSRTIRTPRFSGVLVERVLDGGPAEEAGLEEGDVILAVEARSVRSRDDLLLQLAGKQVGDTLKLSVWRRGETHDVEYEVSEAPGEEQRSGR